ncbi:MAG: L,D-transpeptidase family protein [Bernardetiaceae bacterium]|nr:L,D-transpeptidase family protein [Bernardetiaceae bacterium]
MAWARWYLVAAASLFGGGQPSNFKAQQLRYARVRDAYSVAIPVWQTRLAAAHLAWGRTEVLLRAFKNEQQLEVWARQAGTQQTFCLVHQYPFCTTSGGLGPKRQQGDRQIPEGFYHIQHFNPASNFHLSLGINYPNASDRQLATGPDPGNAIYIHGNCVTIGCIPLGDEGISELYPLCVEARQAGQAQIPVHIFPARGDWQALAAEQPASTQAFWTHLRPGYLWFEQHRRPARVRVGTDGHYRFD